MLVREGRIVERGQWWDPADERPVTHSDPESARAAAQAAIDAALARQRLADVPVGISLSGGVDSSVLATSLRRLTSSPIPAFTISSPGSPHDEAPDAAALAAELDLQHEVLPTTPRHLEAALDEAVFAAHEPYDLKALVPTLLVMSLAKERVKVVLGGDGGDEFFLGYTTQRSLMRDWWLWRLPVRMRRYLIGLGRRRIGPVRTQSALHRSPERYYREMLGRGGGPTASRLVFGADPSHLIDPMFDFPGPATFQSLGEAARRAELRTHLPGILKKVDMASMHHSIEARVPLLDLEVIETAMRIDFRVHLQSDQPKAVLRALLGQRAQARAIAAGKKGFTFPADEWLRGPVVERAAAALTDPWSMDLDSDVATTLWRDFSAGRPSQPWVVWALFSLRLGRDRVAAM